MTDLKDLDEKFGKGPWFFLRFSEESPMRLVTASYRPSAEFEDKWSPKGFQPGEWNKNIRLKALCIEILLASATARATTEEPRLDFAEGGKNTWLASACTLQWESGVQWWEQLVFRNKLDGDGSDGPVNAIAAQIGVSRPTTGPKYRAWINTKKLRGASIYVYCSDTDTFPSEDKKRGRPAELRELAALIESQTDWDKLLTDHLPEVKDAKRRQKTEEQQEPNRLREAKSAHPQFAGRERSTVQQVTEVRIGPPQSTAHNTPERVRMMCERLSPWEPTNHSEFKVPLGSVSNDHREIIAAAATRCFGPHVGEIINVEQVQEDSASLNYKLTCRRLPSILFRVNKRVTTEAAIDALRGICQHLHDNRVLPRSKFRDYILSLKSVEPYPRGCGLLTIGSENQEPLLAAYRYVDRAEHYSGKTRGQLESVAKEFGCLQAALLTLPPSIDLKALCQQRTDISSRSDMVSWYQKIREKYSSPIRSNSERDIPYVLFANNDALIQEAAKNCDGCDNAHSPNEKCAAYVDFHPHNTLFQGDECVLIYDFESCIYQQTQDASLAFALHRFTREYLRSGSTPTLGNAGKAIAAFLKSYSAGGGTVPDDFRRRLPSLIRLVNLRKVFGILEFLENACPDYSARSSDALCKELRKFIMYLKETSFYEP